jgi:hypothetical protein
MANKEKLIEWLVNNIDNYDISFTELTWPQQLGLPYFDFACDLKFNGQITEGRGTSLDKNDALIKAFAEAIERLNTLEVKLKNSNAVASHTSILQANKNALSELIERDSFLCHFLTETPFLKGSTIPQRLLNWAKAFEKNGIEIVFRAMTSPKGHNCVIACGLGTKAKTPFGLIVGTACEETEEAASIKAFFQLSRAISDKILTGKPEPSSIEEFNRLSNPRILDHFQLSLSLDYANQFQKLFLDTFCQEQRKALDTSLANFSIIKEKQDFLGLPIITVKAKHPIAQDMYWGAATSEKINLNRLSHFMDRQITLSDLTRLPHPYR